MNYKYFVKYEEIKDMPIMEALAHIEKLSKEKEDRKASK